MLETNQIANYFGPLPTNQHSYIDLHIHTQASDGFLDLDFLTNFVADKSHLIAVTDHNEISSSVKLYQETNINIVPGIEVGCKDGFELLIYFDKLKTLQNFYHYKVKPHKNDYEIARTEKDYTYYLEAVKDYNCFLSIPHISGIAHKNYLKKKPYINQVLQQVDAVETYNHSLTRKRNRTAQKVRKLNGKFATIGSDAHLKQAVRSFYKLQNTKFSQFAYWKNNVYNILSVIALFGKHLHTLIN